jgi:hypothetical protein
MSERIREDNITAAALRPTLLPAAEGEPAAELRLQRVRNPLPEATVGDLGLAARIVGRAEFASAILLQPFRPRDLTGIDPASVRSFRFDAAVRSLEPVWSSGINVESRRKP